MFRKTTKALTLLIAVFLTVIGVFSTQKILRGLNQNVSLVSGSDIFDYFETLFKYGQAGPPAYVIFNNVDYEDKDNLGNMTEINSQLAQLNDTIQSPIYSWVGPFSLYIRDDVWSEACNSKAVIGLPFDEQMKNFIKIKIESDCCQKYGICGEQYSLDIVFNEQGQVQTTRFRFMHTPLKFQIDYIRALVETRKATDQLAAKLKPKSNTP